MVCSQMSKGASQASRGCTIDCAQMRLRVHGRGDPRLGEWAMPAAYSNDSKSKLPIQNRQNTGTRKVATKKNNSSKGNPSFQ
jgi:hypothetical protein